MTGGLLITGASGYLGRELARQAAASGHLVFGTFHSRPLQIEGLAWRRLDVRDREATLALVAELQPSAMIHTAVREPSDWATNADGAANVALAARATGARLVHMSSDAIFNGASGLYDEAAPPEPISPYGAAKAAAETAVAAIEPRARIVRTSLIIGDEPYKHVGMVLDMLAGRNPGALFTDEVRCPIHVADLAAALLELVSVDGSGVLNVAGAEALSRYDLGVLIARRFGYDPGSLRASTTAASGLRRPTDVRLDIRRAQGMLRTRLRGAREFLEDRETGRQEDKETGNGER